MHAPLVIVLNPDKALADALGRTLQNEAGEALDVRPESSALHALRLAKAHAGELAGVVCEDATSQASLELLREVRHEQPHAKRILVAREEEAAQLARHPEFDLVHALVPGRENYADITSGIVQEILEGHHARRLRGA